LQISAQTFMLIGLLIRINTTSITTGKSQIRHSLLVGGSKPTHMTRWEYRITETTRLLSRRIIAQAMPTAGSIHHRLLSLIDTRVMTLLDSSAIAYEDGRVIASGNNTRIDLQDRTTIATANRTTIASAKSTRIASANRTTTASANRIPTAWARNRITTSTTLARSLDQRALDGPNLHKRTSLISSRKKSNGSDGVLN